MQPDVILPYFAKFIESELGIVYMEHNYFQLQNRLEEIAKFLNIQDPQALYEKAQSGITGQFKQLLLDVATNNETSFFRDPKVFSAIEKFVLPSVVGGPQKGKELLVWSAASSSGQEALSLTMLIKEWSAKNAPALSFSVLGTDISERVLARAKAANYSQLEVQRGLPIAMLVKYFAKDKEDRWTASTEITKHTEFRKLNLKEVFTFHKSFDLVLCRNVLIYQNVNGKIEILNKIFAALKPGGYLVLGAGESLLGLSTAYEQVSAEGVVIYRKKDGLAKSA